jgi:hypothetical protein
MKMARYKPVAEYHGQHVYIGPGSKLDLGTLRQMALARVAVGADADTHAQLKALINTLDEKELRKRMADLERNGDFVTDPVPPEANLTW